MQRFNSHASKCFIKSNRYIMIMVCIDYLLLVIICLRYVSISHICRAIWLVANSRCSRVCGLSCPPRGYAALRQYRTLNSRRNSSHNGQLPRGSCFPFLSKPALGNSLSPFTRHVALSLNHASTSSCHRCAFSAMLRRCHAGCWPFSTMPEVTETLGWSHFFPFLPKSMRTKV